MNQLSDVTKKLVSEQTEIHGISLIDWQEKSWKRTILFNDHEKEAVQLSTAKILTEIQNMMTETQCLGNFQE